MTERKLQRNRRGFTLTEVLLALAILLGGLIVWKHRGNLKRILNGTESSSACTNEKMRGAESMKIAVMGSGGWGTALALVLLENGHEVTLWSYTGGGVHYPAGEAGKPHAEGGAPAGWTGVDL